jgi:DNA modification methylase
MCEAGWKEYAELVAQDLAPVPCTVLDPFLGSGTTAQVALQYGRHVVGIELNPEYLELAKRRLEPLLKPRLFT